MLDKDGMASATMALNGDSNTKYAHRCTTERTHQYHRMQAESVEALCQRMRVMNQIETGPKGKWCLVFIIKRVRSE